MFSTVFFDLDATLYPADNGLWAEIGQRIGTYLKTRMGIPGEETESLKIAYYKKYGTTLSGLIRHHGVDPQDYLAFVHHIRTENYLSPDLELREMILSLPKQKWIFTNSDRAHSRRVLEALFLGGCFDGLVTIEALNYVCKPTPQAYQMALRLAGETDPGQAVLLDDSPRNLLAAKEIGFHTVLVGRASPSDWLSDKNEHFPDLAFDKHITRPHDLPRVMPELWK